MTVRAGRSAPFRYLGALLVLGVGLSMLVLGVRANLVQVAARSDAAQAAHVGRSAADADEAAIARPAVGAPTPSTTPSPTVSASPTTVPAALAADVTFVVSTAPKTTKCWARGCVMWAVEADAACAAASAEVVLPPEAEGADAQTVVHEVGGFAEGRLRIVELDDARIQQAGSRTGDLRLTVRCLTLPDPAS